MYRLLNVKNVSLQNFKWVPKKIWNQCSSCGNPIVPSIESITITFKYQGSRLFATTPNTDATSLLQKPKKRKRQKVKYAELIQVNGTTSMTNKKTTIKKLTMKKLADFVVNTDNTPEDKTKLTALSDSTKPSTSYEKCSVISLESNILQNHEITGETPLLFVGKKYLTFANPMESFEQIIESYHIFKDINSKENENQNILIEEEEVFGHNSADIGLAEELDHIEKDIIESEKSVAVSSKTSKKKYKSKYFNNIEDENLAKDHSLLTNLTSYIKFCIDTKSVGRGLQFLLEYRSVCNQNISLYNLLLGGFATEANFSKITEILGILKSDKIACNAQSYSAIFECLGRLDASEENQKLLRKFQKEAQKNNITLNDIIDHSIFTADKREIVMNVIRRIDPHFTPVYTPPQLEYDNCLLNSLNKHIHPIERTDFPETGCEILNEKRNFTLEQYQQMIKDQLEIEMNGVVKIKSIEKINKEFDSDVLLYRKKFEDLRKQWYASICGGFNRDLNSLRFQLHRKSARSISIYPYLRVLKVEKYADILLEEIELLAGGSETFSQSLGFLYRQIGRKVQQRCHLEQKIENGVLEKTNHIYEQYCKTLCEGRSSDNSRQMWQRLVHKNRFSGASMNIVEHSWPSPIIQDVGRFLYQILMRDVKIDANMLGTNMKPRLLPAFYSIFRFESKVTIEEVKPHPVLIKLHRESQQEMLTLDANMVPMLCPPQPWNTPYNGGYILARSDLIRLPPQAFQQRDHINSSDATCMYPVLDALNQLASVPWKVNTKVLDVILEVFNNGGSRELEVAQPPSALPPLVFDEPENDPKFSNKKKHEMFIAKLSHKRKQDEMYSLWCDTLYRLSLANHYRDKVFWLPHNLDFRGRVYPIPPHLNHLGSDLARSLLVFHQAKPLGVDGFDWLKLHCINLTGHKKRESVPDRLVYAEEMMENIIDSADNPLTGRMWWLKSDEPWQTLTACMEIANVMRSPDPEKYLSSFPIHQDGSCNGLQHYAALGRDTAGAKSVNVCPADVPQDVYSDVVDLVEKLRKSDAEAGNELARILNGFVKRKVIKQTVMTTVYGVTRYGARHQIAKQLKAIDSFPSDRVWSCAGYLALKTFESLHEMFAATKQIQDWLTTSARLISAIGGQNVEWITPLGLPVVQPYSKHNKYMASIPTKSIKTDLFSKPNIMKQTNAFPPNFIHSLDSTHMMLTSLHCERAGFTFMSVHDCYWTHACTVPDMNKICREQFLALHSQPILEDLSKYLVEKFSYNNGDFHNDGSKLDDMKRNLNKVLRDVPSRGELDLKTVLDSVYFFS